MPTLGHRSSATLRKCHHDLVRLAHACIPLMDFSVTDGFRGEEAQEAAYHAGLSKLRWPRSKHNQTPSLAVHFNPWPIDWHDLDRFYFLAGIVRAQADGLDIAIRWGGNWNQSLDPTAKDQSFMDLAHFELTSD